MKRFTLRTLTGLVLLTALPVALGARPASAAAMRVVTTTEDLASLAREVGGDKVVVVALAKGYQDPHFVDPKPSFILEISRADVLIVVGRELEIGWLPPLLSNSRNAKVQVGGNGYLDASQNVKILEIPTGQITRAMGDVHPQGNPHYWLDPEQRAADRAGDPRQAQPARSSRQGVLRPALRRLRQAAHGRGEALGRGAGAVQGREGRDLPSLVAELHGALGPGRDGLRRAEAGHSADDVAHARADRGDEGAGRAASSSSSRTST